MAAAILTAERLRELLHYNPDTGVFTRITKVPRGSMPGIVRGTKKYGYLNFSVDGRVYRAHRLAWLYMTGEWPVEYVDHINGVKDDNRFANLRAADGSLNTQNQRKARKDNLSTGLLGVSWNSKRNIYKASIRINGKLTHLKNCKTAEEAHQVYLEAKRKYHAGCTI
jgi:hypothetical protein